MTDGNSVALTRTKTHNSCQLTYIIQQNFTHNTHFILSPELFVVPEDKLLVIIVTK